MRGVFEISTAVGCHVGCSYCPQEEITRAYDKRTGDIRMSLTTFKKCLKKLPKDLVILFSGMCEPFQNTKTYSMIRHAHEEGFGVGVYTTLHCVCEKCLMGLEDIPFRCFVVHVVETTPKDMFQKYSRFSNFNVEIRSNWNTHSRAGNVKGKSCPNHTGPVRCGVSMDLTHNVLMPNGDVVLCCMDYGMKHVLGNLLEQSYESLFEGEAFRRVIEGQLSKDGDVLCRKCDVCVSAL